MEKNLKAIKEAGIRVVGEELPRTRSTPKKPKKTSYPVNNKWFHGGDTKQ